MKTESIKVYTEENFSDFLKSPEFKYIFDEDPNNQFRDYLDITEDNIDALIESNGLSFLDIIGYICESCDDYKERTDSCYIYTEYFFKFKNIKYSFEGSQYRKDHSICDMDLDEVLEFYVEDLTQTKNDKLSKKLLKESNWKDFIDTHTKEEIFEKVKTLKF